MLAATWNATTFSLGYGNVCREGATNNEARGSSCNQRDNAAENESSFASRRPRENAGTQPLPARTSLSPRPRYRHTNIQARSQERHDTGSRSAHSRNECAGEKHSVRLRLSTSGPFHPMLSEYRRYYTHGVAPQWHH